MTLPLALDGTVPLTHWALIRARGADALTFLQGQLTNDMAGMGPHDVRLAGFCSAKGRLQASFVVWRPGDDEFMLACSASLLAVTLKRLSMFVLRARCQLSDASAELPLHGVVGASAAALIGDAAVWQTRAVAGGTLLRLPDVADVPRAVIAAASTPFDAPLDAHSISLDTWRWLEVRSGIPTVEAATFEKFVPQMLNYELIGGVDFQKGCYPGQEVVARSQYRGTVKRRMFLFDCDVAASAGQDVFHSADADQPAGMVVNAAPSPAGGGSASLIEVKLAALDAGSLHLGAPQGAHLRRSVLPYDVPLTSAAPV